MSLENCFIYFVSLKTNFTHRTIWLTLIAGWVCYLGYATYLFMDDFTKKTVSTKVRVETANELQVINLCIPVPVLLYCDT